MKKAIAERWAWALESGKYLQTLSCLKDEGGYCCLGVLTDLFLKEHGFKWKRHRRSRLNDGLPIYSFDGSTHTLPKEVCKWAGLESDNPYFGNIKATELNDGFLDTFEEIAARIIENYKEIK